MNPHPVDEFWSLLQELKTYPPDVRPVREMLPGTAAFAASAGLCRQPGTRELPPFPYRGLMVVGHNLDSYAGYEQRRSLGVSHGDVVPGRRPMSTWLGLYRLLDRAGVDTRRLFFTNLLVGLKEGRPTGAFTAYPAPEFRRWCRAFLEHQLVTMRPRVVLVLGGPASQGITAMATPAPWPAGPLPPAIPVVARLSGHETILVPAHHTSMQKRLAADADALGRAWRSVAGND